MNDYIISVIGILIILFFANLLWSQLDRLTGSNRVPWYRRLFWQQTAEDLLAALQVGKRTEISGEEVELAKAYQRRRLPPDIRFPKTGEIYEAIDNLTVEYVTAYLAPFTGGGRAALPRGERVRVRELSCPEPLGVYCDPLNYDALHDRIVSAEERAHEQYDGYYLSIDTMNLNRCFRLVESPKKDEDTTKHAG